jgi:ribose transport system ATP-binding protein/rhamnose transport system ATP-binding protein
MTAPAAEIRARGISKSFGGAVALRDVDVELYPGEVHALMGMNGAGKSTLVRILSGAPNPDGGVIVRHRDGRYEGFFVKFNTQSLNTADNGLPR